ncbi:MAG: sulfurtransferase TusA family protein [Candidatus Thorarchaeota archaeon]|jgi:tRNA 2-thiouridine synthesizing protein A
MTHDVARTFDASGLRCPMPILKAKKEIQEIQIGEILKLIARTGNEIIELVEEGDKLVWYLKRVK